MEFGVFSPDLVTGLFDGGKLIVFSVCHMYGWLLVNLR
jgi:hypothetical protein